jgi:PAS domain S-box-containing protein
MNNTTNFKAPIKTLPESYDFPSMFDNIDQLVYISDPESHELLYVNQTVKETFGDILGKKCYNALQNLDSQCPFCTNDKIFGKNLGKTHTWDYQNRVNERWYHSINRAIPWSSSRMVRWGMDVDITERKLKELKNREQENDLSLLKTLNESANRGDTFQDIFDLLERETKKIFESKGVTVYLLNEDKNCLELQNYVIPKKVSESIEKLIGMKIPSQVKVELTEESIHAKILKDKKPVIISEIQQINKIIKEHTKDSILRKLANPIRIAIGIQSIIFLPMLTGKNEILGLLSLSRKKPFHESDVNRLNAISTDLINIINRKIAEESLVESENKFRILSEQSPNMIFINQKGKIVYVNKRCEETMGYAKEEFYAPDFNFLELISPEYTDLIKSRFQKLQKGEDIPALEYAIVTKRGERIEAVLTTKLIEYKGESAILGTVIDITERKKAQREKEKMTERLFESQKMEAIGRLTGGIAHDFNNILTGIMAFADSAFSKIDESTPYYEDIKQIIKNSQQASELTRQLLFFSNKQPSEFKMLDINSVINNVKIMLNRIISKEIKISTDLLKDSPCNVLIDEAQINRVIMNLVINAKDAILHGGEIVIKTDSVKISKSAARKSPDAYEGSFICISVMDTGTGIKKEIIHYIFEPFFSTKQISEGTGLGLSVVYGIVKQHKGFIEVESEIGKGSTFMVYLPCVKE